MKRLFIAILIMLTLLTAVGCGGSTGPKTNPVTGQNLVDPSGNWAMQFTDSSSNVFILSGLFSQTGPNVTGIHFSEAGETLTINFTCGVQPDISLANGLVQNINQFSGDLSGNFGTIHFSSVLNDAGTHTSGTYTVTPGALGICLGIALTGTFVADGRLHDDDITTTRRAGSGQPRPAINPNHILKRTLRQMKQLIAPAIPYPGGHEH